METGSSTLNDFKPSEMSEESEPVLPPLQRLLKWYNELDQKCLTKKRVISSDQGVLKVLDMTVARVLHMYAIDSIKSALDEGSVGLTAAERAVVDDAIVEYEELLQTYAPQGSDPPEAPPVEFDVLTLEEMATPEHDGD